MKNSIKSTVKLSLKINYYFLVCKIDTPNLFVAFIKEFIIKPLGFKDIL